jgi:hypothetical protein
MIRVGFITDVFNLCGLPDLEGFGLSFEVLETAKDFDLEFNKPSRSKKTSKV